MHFKYLSEGRAIKIDILFDDEKELMINQDEFIRILPDYVSHKLPHTVTIKNGSLILEPKDETAVLQLKDLDHQSFELKAYSLLATMLAELVETNSKEDKREEKNELGPISSSFQSVQTQHADPAKIKLLFAAAEMQREELTAKIASALEKGEDPGQLFFLYDTFDAMIKTMSDGLRQDAQTTSEDSSPEAPLELKKRAAFKLFLLKKIDDAQEQHKTVCLFEPSLEYPDKDKLCPKTCLNLSIDIVLDDGRYITSTEVSALPGVTAALQQLTPFVSAMNAKGYKTKFNHALIQIEYDENTQVSPSQRKQVNDDYLEACCNALCLPSVSCHREVLFHVLEEWNKIFPISEKSFEIFSMPTSASSQLLGRKSSKEKDEKREDVSPLTKETTSTIADGPK